MIKKLTINGVEYIHASLDPRGRKAVNKAEYDARKSGKDTGSVQVKGGTYLPVK